MFMKESNIYLKRITISKFRGVSSDLELTFYNQNGNNGTTSTVIVGDNGSGKSSIIDAIELLLLGTIHRSTGLNSKSTPEVISQFSDKEPLLILELSNNETIKRQIVVNTDGQKKCEIVSGEHKKFFFCPFILRRSDILMFWNTPDVQRQKIFWRFVPYNNKSEEAPEFTKIATINEKIYGLKQERNIAREKISEMLQISIDDIPYEIPEIYVFIKDTFYKGNKLGVIQIMQRKRNVCTEEEETCFQYIDLQERLRQLKTELNCLKKCDSPCVLTAKERTTQIFNELSPRITQNFIKLSTTADFVEKVEILISDLSEISISFIVTLKNGNSVYPEQIFSEANLDLLAFVISIELIRYSSENGQPKVMVLDDVFQSVDSSVRLKVIDYLLTDFKNWQFIITVHDRLWKEQLIQLFRYQNCQLNTVEILNWNSAQGPIITSESLLIEDTLVGSLEKGSTNEILSNASILLEMICSNLSYRLPISVTRKSNDRYTIGDLWPGIAKKLRKTSISEEIEDLNRLIYLRNVLGGHFNDWAMCLSRGESLEYANSVLNLLPKVKCKDCNRWIEVVKIGDKLQDEWSCRCGSLKIKKLNP